MLKSLSLRTRFSVKPAAIEFVLVVCSCLFVYLANGQKISSNDSIPNAILAFNWLEHQTLTFDALRNSAHYLANDLAGPGGIPYYFTEAPNGHLTSVYPIGVAILSFPLYCLFYLYAKIAQLPIDLTQPPGVLENLPDFEKWAGASLAALGAGIFYLSVRLKFSLAVAIMGTFVYAFATGNWVVGSQGLWQHTASNLALVCTVFCLFKANRTTGNRQNVALLTAGIFCGLLPGIRPSSLLFAIALGLYGLLTYRWKAIYLLLGQTSALLNTAWNVYFFGLSLRSLLVGGYVSLFKNSASSYGFSFPNIWGAF
jgi:hypothetical protein